MRYLIQRQTTDDFQKGRFVVFWSNDINVIFGTFVTFKMVRIRRPRRIFCVRLRHNALSALEKYKADLFRAKFRRYALASGIIQYNHPAKRILVALSILNLLRARRIENKVWINPLPLGLRRNLFIDQWHEEQLYQDFGFEKRQMRAILQVIRSIFSLLHFISFSSLFFIRLGEYHLLYHSQLEKAFMEKQLFSFYYKDGIFPAN